MNGNNKKMKIGFLGYSEECIRQLVLSYYFRISCVIVPVESMISKDLRTELIKLKIRVIAVSSYQDTMKELLAMKAGNFIICRFPYIITDNIIATHTFFNIHPGDLRTNRGAHPIIWSILRNESRTCLSLYRLSTQIDLGLLIDQQWVDILPEDDTTKLRSRLYEKFPQIFEALYQFLNGERNGEEIKDGIYRPRVTPKDYTIDIENDSYITIKKKICSQKAYTGAILNVGDYEFRVTNVNKRKESV